jgi:hypothetical protein
LHTQEHSRTPTAAAAQVRLHTDKDTRKSKGYAHVHFADDAGLEQ